MDEYATMKDIGTVFGVSSHAVGRKLLELGYRTEKKKPSGKAFHEGWSSRSTPSITPTTCGHGTGRRRYDCWNRRGW